MPNRPPSPFEMGQPVRVLSRRAGMPRLGTIRDIFWHFQDERYYYDLEADGKNVTGRFSETDLEAVV